MIVSGVIDIGGIPVALTFSNAAFFKYFHQRYDNFFAAKLPRYNIFVEELPQIDNKSDKIETSIEKNLVKFYTNFYKGYFDLARSTVKARVFLHPITFDNFLRTIMGMIVLLEDSLLIHGLGFIEEEKSFIVTGSWLDVRQKLADIIDKKLLLSDSLVMVKKSQEQFIAYSTPFNSDMKNKTYNIHAPLTALMFSKSSDTTEIRDISRKEASMKTMGLGFHIPCKKRSTSDYMNLVEQMIKEIIPKEVNLDIKNLDLKALASSFKAPEAR